jgi:diacylglycerol kinase
VESKAFRKEKIAMLIMTVACWTLSQKALQSLIVPSSQQFLLLGFEHLGKS